MDVTAVPQTATIHQKSGLATKEDLEERFVGKHLSEIRTPAVVIERRPFQRNCQAMKDRCEKIGATFRAHIKSHKTVEGTRLQLQTTPPSDAVVCSTLPEAWGLVRSGLAHSIVKDILYGFPLPLDKLEDLFALRKHVRRLTVLVDCVQQVRGIDEYASRSDHQALPAFIKIDQGNERAGVTLGSQTLETLIEAILASPALELSGFYTHSGNAYSARSAESAAEYLEVEVEAVLGAAELASRIAKRLQRPSPPLTLAVGSTPTAHASLAISQDPAASPDPPKLEVHAGVYPLLDLQQRATGMLASPDDDMAVGILARVCSTYPQRVPPQILIDAGAVALSKDTGPSGTFGEVYGASPLKNWRLTKISQEHGILSPPLDTSLPDAARVVESVSFGTTVRLRPQHACLALAGHAWYYVVDDAGDDTIREIWVPWKGW